MSTIPTVDSACLSYIMHPNFVFQVAHYVARAFSEQAPDGFAVRSRRRFALSGRPDFLRSRPLSTSLALEGLSAMLAKYIQQLECVQVVHTSHLRILFTNFKSQSVLSRAMREKQLNRAKIFLRKLYFGRPNCMLTVNRTTLISTATTTTTLTSTVARLGQIEYHSPHFRA